MEHNRPYFGESVREQEARRGYYSSRVLKPAATGQSSWRLCDEDRRRIDRLIELLEESLTKERTNDR